MGLNKIELENEKANFGEVWKLQDIIHDLIGNSESKHFKYKLILEELDQDYKEE